jgi:F1F0 ATPase subunit 2
MTEFPMLALTALAGSALGALFFGGLWWTVRKGVSTEQPAFWFAGSLLVRTVVTIVGFLAVSRGEPLRLTACLVGFALARLLAMRVTQPSRSARPPLERKAADAP